MVIQKQALTLEEYLALGEDSRVEIINWEQVEMTAAGGVHQIIAANILRILDKYVYERDLGLVLPDQMTYLMNSPESGLKDSFVPDVSYISHDNVPKDWDVEKPHPACPDLAIEIISPGNDAELIQEKVRIYLEKGTKQVWLIYPKTKEVHQYTSATPEKSHIYRGAESIDAESLFPKIQGLNLSAIFKLPKWAIKEKK
jgi:Uma2 family endonuclease